MISDQSVTGAVMEEDDFDKYEIDDEFKRVFWQVGGHRDKTVNGTLSDDQDLRSWLKTLLEDEDLERHKDVVFLVGEKGDERSVRAHRLILTTRSKTFADILEKELDQHQSISISGVDPAVFETIVHYVYTGQIEAPRRVLQTVDLMHAAAKYDIAPLHAVIKQFLEKRLPKLRIKHFIMITQRVIDLRLTELDQSCFQLVEARTDQVVQDPMFLRVSSGFIARLLDLDNFSGITEAAVFARVLEWATLRSGGSILQPPSTHLLTEDNSYNGETGFHLTRPDVRNVLELFIRSFRLTSVPKDDLASLVKNSGVFTEHEQLVVSYYLLDQTKNLEDFSMKPRGTKIGSKRADHTRLTNSPQKSAPKVVTPKPAPESVRSRAIDTEIPHADRIAAHPAGNPASTEPVSEVFRIFDGPSGSTSETVSLFRVDTPPPIKKPAVEPQQAEHVHNPDFSIQHITKSPPLVQHKTTETPPPPPPPVTPKLLDKFKQKFSSDKQSKQDDKSPKPKKDKKVKKTLSGRSVQSASMKGSSSSSSSSAASSRNNSPTRLSRRSINVDGDTKDDNELLTAIRKVKPDVAKRPKSMYEEDLVEYRPDSPKTDPGSGSVGKKGGIRSRITGFMTPTKKWSPEQVKAGKDSKLGNGKPAPPPRVKSTSDLSSKRNVEATI
ncbi:hypothetical protein BV898_00516 [Hypsibius exemplaris]|uniref:BTB domain-containing protein n=1 Tax=Hypsibius exemplaris TaxID=2072580 RepID=A0A1W0XDQ1_HYPEX|nr:hypothetical protein BV898_00516 [Hypsibius exemplaris]